MELSQGSKSTAQKSKKPLIITTVIVAVIIVGLLWALTKTFSNNAEVITKPLENGLVKAGGIKRCTLSNSGRMGFLGSSTVPWYQVYYELHQPREQAKATVMKIAAENGYQLKQATLENRGPVTVADPYVDDWLYNAAETKSTFTDLEAGNVTLFAQVINTPGSYTCDSGSITIDANAETSTVRWDVKLPRLKR